MLDFVSCSGYCGLTDCPHNGPNELLILNYCRDLFSWSNVWMPELLKITGCSLTEMNTLLFLSNLEAIDNLDKTEGGRVIGFFQSKQFSNWIGWRWKTLLTSENNSGYSKNNSRSFSFLVEIIVLWFRLYFSQRPKGTSAA